MTMAVNVSARQLRNHGIVGRVQRALFESGLPRGALTLELTESTLMENPTGAPEVLGRLKALGVDLAIDDFGTGYSSLAYLRGFPVDTVKIDRAFVMNVDGPDSADATLVAAIVAMADALGIATIAEGVESETQAERLAGARLRARPGLPLLAARSRPTTIPATIDPPRGAGPRPAAPGARRVQRLSRPAGVDGRSRSQQRLELRRHAPSPRCPTPPNMISCMIGSARSQPRLELVEVDEHGHAQRRVEIAHRLEPGEAVDRRRAMRR